MGKGGIQAIWRRGGDLGKSAAQTGLFTLKWEKQNGGRDGVRRN